MPAASARPMRIGLLGGSFDPVHEAHLALGRAAVETLALDELRWIPAGQPWQKARRITPAEHRVAMLRLALGDEPRFVLDERELHRSGPSYTLDTVRELQAERTGADWFLVIGQDQYAGLHTWHGWQELLARVKLAVAMRPGVPAAVDPRVGAHAHEVVRLPMLDVSSTEIRARVAKGLSITALVPASVAGYIDQHRLYRGPNGS